MSILNTLDGCLISTSENSKIGSDSVNSLGSWNNRETHNTMFVQTQESGQFDTTKLRIHTGLCKRSRVQRETDRWAAIKLEYFDARRWVGNRWRFCDGSDFSHGCEARSKEKRMEGFRVQCAAAMQRGRVGVYISKAALKANSCTHIQEFIASPSSSSSLPTGNSR